MQLLFLGHGVLVLDSVQTGRDSPIQNLTQNAMSKMGGSEGGNNRVRGGGEREREMEGGGEIA